MRTSAPVAEPCTMVPRWLHIERSDSTVPVACVTNSAVPPRRAVPTLVAVDAGCKSASGEPRMPDGRWRREVSSTAASSPLDSSAPAPPAAAADAPRALRMRDSSEGGGAAAEAAGSASSCDTSSINAASSPSRPDADDSRTTPASASSANAGSYRVPCSLSHSNARLRSSRYISSAWKHRRGFRPMMPASSCAASHLGVASPTFLLRPPALSHTFFSSDSSHIIARSGSSSCISSALMMTGSGSPPSAAWSMAACIARSAVFESDAPSLPALPKSTPPASSTSRCRSTRLRLSRCGRPTNCERGTGICEAEKR
mmetsp:Transcript_21944/g.76944  ORF Transcript_21944/g.76944 Transcript_21944/m.76944 type:complete len:314 (+) Transcript_21944:2267-3208(+)